MKYPKLLMPTRLPFLLDLFSYETERLDKRKIEYEGHSDR